MTSIKLKDFITKIIRFNNIDEILEQHDDYSLKGFMYERLWDLVIKFGFCDEFPKSKYTHMIGNVNNGNIKPLTSIANYVEKNKVCSGNSGGCSDITLYDNIANEYIFISSKFPKSDEGKDVKYYDVHNIIAMCNDNKEIYEKYKIYILVPDKNKVIDKIHKSNKSSLYITKYMNNILDIADLNKAFKKFRKDIAECNFDDYDEIYCDKKEKICARFHQKLIVSKTLKLINNSKKQILWGCKCRSGKTYMVGYLISELSKIKDNINVMIITPAPSETIPQFTDDLFNKFTDFKNFKIHEITNGKELINIQLNEQNNIIVVSKQLMQNYIGDDKVAEISELKLDLIVFDENHFSGTTLLSKEILKSYTDKKTVKIYLTATYNKPLHEWNIDPECQLYWDIEDEKYCKQHNIDKLVEKHGKIVNEIVKNEDDNIFEPYNKYPEMHLITNMWDSERYDEIKEKIMDSKYGFSFEVLFSLNKYKKFHYPNEIKKVLRYISGSNKEHDFKDGDKSILTRINNICENSNSRIPFTQIWFLPDNNINNISLELKNLMEEDTILQKYDIIIVNSNNDKLSKDIKSEIKKAEKMAMKNNRDGVIILAGNMLSLGITLENCDVVFLMNNTLSADKVMQQMYRCMTEAENKKYGYIVDMNISRVLNTCISYNIKNTTLSFEDKLKYNVNNIINFDGDYFENTEINTKKIIEQLSTIWRNNPLNHYIVLLKNLDDSVIQFNNETQKLINQKFMQIAKDRNTLNAKILVGEIAQELPTGKEIIGDKNVVDTEEEKMQKIKAFFVSFPRDVLHYIIPLTCILTIDSDRKNFMDMINMIKNNKELLEIFDEQTQIWWSNSGLIDIIKEIASEYYDENSVVYSISVQIKMQIKSLIDSPKQLLELIDECLKPKEIEKRKFGEVFTPMYIINEMLDQLPKKVWKNEKLKWFDPATGMGNFPIAVYLRLMESLKEKIPDDNKRKRHILENMLYMSELNKKNCYVVHQIFNMNKRYKLNLYCGDTLKMNIKKVFGVDKFDIIMGNPPYNKEVIMHNVSLPLYNEFIEKFIDMCTYMTFIIPSRWFAGGKGLNKFRSFMLSRNDIKLIKHFDDASKIFGKMVDIKGGVNYFLKDETHNGLCKFNNSMTQLNKYDVFVDSKFYKLIDKMITYDNITKIYIGRYFGIESNDKRLSDNENNLKCYVSKQKGFVKYIDIKYVKKDYKFWKVITPKAAYGGSSGFGNTFIGKRNEIHTGSYISFKVNSESESESFLSYLQCKLPNLMLSLRKNSHNLSSDTCKWIPLPPLDRKWDDEKIIKYFNFDKDEIELIENTKVVGYDN